jgi:hypothetical protein
MINMLKQQEINYVIEKMSYWLTYIKISNSKSYTDINRISEGFVMNLLNIVFDWELEDLNKKQMNYPGIDLGDSLKGIAVQVTSEKTSSKIKDTYEKIYAEKNNINGRLISDIYNKKIYFFIITDDWKYRFEKNTLDELATVSHNRYGGDDILTGGQVIEIIEELFDSDFLKFQEVYKLISQYIDKLPDIIDDKVIIEGFLQCFDRPMFITPFYLECNLPDFEQAITDTIEAINTGMYRLRDGTIIKKIIPKTEIHDKSLRKEVDELVKGLILLRSNYRALLNIGEIKKCDCKNPDCGVHLMSEKACKKMDSDRQMILKRVQKLSPRFHGQFLDI